MKLMDLKNILLVLILLLLTACGGRQNLQVGDNVEPSTVETIAVSEYSRVRLTEKAVERLDIQTVPVVIEQVDGSMYKLIPYSAVMYGLQGETWTYTNPEPLVYVRQSIVVERIDGDKAILSEGPEVGTLVVTVGASLLYGAEVGVSK